MSPRGEASLRTLLDALSDPIFLIDRRGVVLQASPSVARFLGKPPEEILGRDILSFLPSRDPARRRERFREVIRTGKPRTIETTSDGRIFVSKIYPILGRSGRVERLAVIHNEVTRLREAEARAAETEARYEGMVESASDAVVSLENGIVTYGNPRLLELSGYSLEEILGQPAERFVHPAELPLVLSHLAQRKGDPSYRAQYETVVKSKEGKDIFVEVNSSALNYPKGSEATLVIMRDITERKKAETALREAEDRYRRLVDSSVAGIYITQENKLRFCNGKFAEIFGYASPQEMAGIPIQVLVAPESWQLVRRQTLLREGGRIRAANYEFRAVRKDGRTIDVEVFGTTFEFEGRPAIQGMLIDITERKSSARALAESNARLESLIQAIPDLVFFKDAEGRHQAINKAYERVVGLPPDRILGRTDAELYPKELVDQYQESDRRILAEREPLRFEEALKTPQGAAVFYETVKAPIVDGRGQAVGIVGVSRDITQQKRNERVKSAILGIAQAVISSSSLETFFRSIHAIIARLMPAENFYIAVHDEATGLLTFPYFVDEFDPPPAPKPLGKGLTEYVLRTGRPLLATPGVFADLEAAGEVESIGAPSIDWVGVPLTIQYRTFGVLVVQSYREGVRYGEEERDILRFVSGQVSLALQRWQAAEQVREREQFLSGVLDSIQDGISIMSGDYTILRVNPTMEKWHAGKLPLVGRKCFEAYHGRTTPCDSCPTRRTLETGTASHEIVRGEGQSGPPTDSWMDLYSFPFIDEKTGEMKGVIEYVRDITLRKQAEDSLQASLQEKEVLLREIHHRVKNNLQVIQALINLQSRRIKDEQALEMSKESQRRIRSMALVHERLYRSTNLSRIDFADYLRSLVVHLFHSVQPGAGRVDLRLELEPVELEVSTAVPCGLIASELVSNSLKHAFPEERAGTVVVSLHREASGDIRLGVQDDGVGLPADFDVLRAESLGMQIVMTLVSQIDGRLTTGGGPGADFQVAFREAPARTPTEKP